MALLLARGFTAWDFLADRLRLVDGAAGSVVVFLMWVYYSSQTLFFGAELIGNPMYIGGGRFNYSFSIFAFTLIILGIFTLNYFVF